MGKKQSKKQIKLDKLRGRYHQLKKKKEKRNADVREMMRCKALIALYEGVDIETVAKCYGVGVKTLKKWKKSFEAQEKLGDKARSGRPPGLSSAQKQKLKEMITQDNQRVWTARHIYLLIKTTFSVTYSSKYLPELLRALGLSYHKAVHILAKKNAEKRQKWIQETLPALYAKAIKEGWRIFFVDEVGFQTEGTLTYSWGPKGEKIQIKNYGRHGRVNMIGAFELGSGVFYGLLTSFKVKSQRYRRFLCHLKREMRQDKIMVIADNASFHKAKWLQKWYTQQQEWLYVEFLPAYSPDFNPIERLWRWMKTEYIHNQCWVNKAALKKTLQGMLQEMPQRVNEVKSVMRKEIERLRLVFEAYETPFPFTMPA